MMKPRTAFVLAALGAVSVAVGWVYGTPRSEAALASIRPGTLAFPGLTAELQHATRVEVEHAGKTLVVEKHGDSWGLADHGDYPVQGQKLRSLLTGLTELRLAEPRTADPAQYGRLGVDDPDKPGSTADLLRVLDVSGKPVAALIVGHRRVRTQGDVPEEIYVRRPGEKQSWLAEGKLEVDADPSLWLDRDIANIDNAKIVSVSVTTDEQNLQFAREKDKPELIAPAEHPKLDDYKVEDVFRAFEFLTFTDVRPGALPGQQVGTASFTTKDGMKIDVTLSKADKNVWAAFGASGTKEAEAFNAKVKGWAYQLGSWKQAALTPSLADLTAAPPAKPAAAAPAEAPSPAPAAPPKAEPAAK